MPIIIGGLVGGVAVLIGIGSYDDHSDHSAHSEYNDAAVQAEKKRTAKKEEIKSAEHAMESYRESQLSNVLPSSWSSVQSVDIDVDQVTEQLRKNANSNSEHEIESKTSSLNREIGEINDLLTTIEKIRAEYIKK